MVEASPSTINVFFEPLAQHVNWSSTVRVDLFRSGSAGNHLFVNGTVLGREQLFVSDVGVGVVDALLLGVVKGVNDHVIVKHLRL